MGVSINWLKTYVDIDWSAEELAHRLTMAGIAIEGVEAQGKDTVMELDLTPNRADCLGMINLAREVAALTGNPLKIPAINLLENRENIDDYIRVEIEAPDLCPRYTARVVKNVQIKPSPDWMQEALINSGIRPINNIVDITNYVMLEANQPLHAFDYNLLGKEKKIVVRKAEYQENFVTLDGVERELDLDSLVITDGIRPVALAGIMGGLDTEITDNTTEVLIESAHFLYSNIRRTSRKQVLRSDSSIRFEKGTDPNGVIYAVNRAASLMQELGGGEIVRGICDVYPRKKETIVVGIRPNRVNYLLGTELSSREIKSYLEKLNFDMKEKRDYLEVKIPTYRPDISREADLIEEVARLYGYDNIPATIPSGVSKGGLTPYQQFRDKLKEVLSGCFNEVVNYSFVSPQVFDRMMLPPDAAERQVIQLANPLSEEQSIMRTLLLPGLLDNLSRNLARKNENLAFYEVGSVFIPTGEQLPDEQLKIAAVVTGHLELNWLKNKVDLDFFYLKGVLEVLLQEMGITGCRFVSEKLPFLHPGRTAGIYSNDHKIGVIGEIHPLVLQNFAIKERACGFELDVDQLFKLTARKKMTDEIARYPSVKRDIALLLKQEVTAADALAAIKASEPELLRDVVVFDIYTGAQVPEGYKSAAFSLTFQSMEKTLADADISNSVQNILNNLRDQLGAVLR